MPYTPPRDPDERFEEARKLAGRLRKCLRYLGNSSERGSFVWRRLRTSETYAEDTVEALHDVEVFRKGRQEGERKAQDVSVVRLDEVPAAALGALRGRVSA